jgi:hypothetical protein
MPLLQILLQIAPFVLQCWAIGVGAEDALQPLAEHRRVFDLAVGFGPAGTFGIGGALATVKGGGNSVPENFSALGGKQMPDLGGVFRPGGFVQPRLDRGPVVIIKQQVKLKLGRRGIGQAQQFLAHGGKFGRSFERLVLGKRGLEHKDCHFPVKAGAGLAQGFEHRHQ